LRPTPNLENQVPVFTYIPQERGAPVIPPDTGFPLRRLHDSHGYASTRQQIKMITAYWSGSRDSDWLLAGGPRGRRSSPGSAKNFLFSSSSRPALESTQPPTQRVLEALSSGLKRPVREADHSPPASVEVKRMWVYTSITPYAFMA
jgi:hypothetical protein